MQAYSRWIWLIVTLLLLLGVTVARAGEKSDADILVGRWDCTSKKTASYIRFYPLKEVKDGSKEGRLKLCDSLFGQEGKWRLMEGENIIEIFVPSGTPGQRVQEVKYILDGDTLELKLLKRWEKYERSR